MQKIIVETNGSFMLNDLGGAQIVEPNRPTVVLQTPFMDKRVNARQLKNHGEVPAGSSDADMAKLWEMAKEDNSEADFRKNMVDMFNDGDAVSDAINSRGKPKRQTKAQKDAQAALQAAEKELSDAGEDGKAAAEAKVAAAKQAVEAANK